MLSRQAAADWTGDKMDIPGTHGDITAKPWYERLGLVPKNLITFSISGLALCVAAGTAYYNIVQTREEISAVINKAPTVYRSLGTLTVTPYEADAVFINSGNKPAVVMSAEVLLLQQSRGWAPCGWFSNDITRFETDLAPLELKPGDTRVVKIKRTKPVFGSNNVKPAALAIPMS